ncbi:TPA: hypothetical protein DDZ86_04995 [Candidatus Dependentiae bacterium]|nr:MAG: hypothetical protein A2Y17_09800 [Clostridiales bacterium GWF2_38_85]HBL98968.1 hypothetical protein [Candidatus Dependentiae bacterium]
MTKLFRHIACLSVFMGAGFSGVVYGSNNNPDEVKHQREEKVLRDRKILLGVATGFLVPFAYTMINGKSLENMALRPLGTKSENLTLLARIGLVLGACPIVVNALVSCATYEDNEQESLWENFIHRQGRASNMVARSLAGPALCFALNDHYWLPLITSILFSGIESYVSMGHTATWAHQGGIIAGTLAGRVGNQLIARVARSMQGGALVPQPLNVPANVPTTL